jgi:dethiobiotin synthase
VLRGLFVTGTDTGVGKTVVSAALLLRYRPIGRVRYWKPIQTGTVVDDDTQTVASLAGCGPAAVLDQGIRLPDPLSPHLAASRVGQRVGLEPLVDLGASQAPDDRWIVEGAGGVLVPINESTLMVDLIRRLGLPAVVVARTSLGTINHTLLTLEALRARDVPVAGVVMNGAPNPDNRASIQSYGRVQVLGELPLVEPCTPETLARHAHAVDPEARLAGLLR